jgi:2-polyprenyl-6-methoxyphenol hydroxylase-like FAD-dependent oxidoreductase
MKNDMSILVSGASFAGLSTAYWMNKLGYKVTVVEIANDLRTGGTPVDVKDNTVDIAKRMGIFEQIKSNRLNPKTMEFRNADDVREGSMSQHQAGDEFPGDEFEIERDELLKILFDTVKNGLNSCSTPASAD